MTIKQFMFVIGGFFLLWVVFISWINGINPVAFLAFLIIGETLLLLKIAGFIFSLWILASLYGFVENLFGGKK